ncbi:MAG: hypothetical protein ABIS29_05135 [Vicinamibacterales bacterium]
MPTNRHVDDVLPVSPAWAFLLLAGRLSGDTKDSCRLRGWVEQCQSVTLDPLKRYDYTPRGDALWREHGAALTREAAEHSFVPYWAKKVKPSGVGFEQWQRKFLAEHTY